MIDTSPIGTCNDIGEPFGPMQVNVYRPPQFNKTTHRWEHCDTNPAVIMVEQASEDVRPDEIFFVRPEQAVTLAHRLLEVAAELNAQQ
jgi:hypothetical protein